MKTASVYRRSAQRQVDLYEQRSRCNQDANGLPHGLRRQKVSVHSSRWAVPKASPRFKVRHLLLLLLLLLLFTLGTPFPRQPKN